MKTALIIILSLCTLTVCTGCNKQDPFENGENPFLYNGEASTSGVTGATTLAVRTDEEDLIGGTSFDRTISIRFNEGGQATVSGDANNIVKVNGNRVTADNTSTSEKVRYELSGSTSNGCFKLYSKNKQAIILNDVSITNPVGAAINNQGKKRCFVVVNGNNSLSDGTSYTETPATEDEKAAFFSEGQLIFSGSGSLSVSARASNHEAIESEGKIEITGGSVCAWSTGNDGLDANGNLYIEGGVVYAIGSGGAELAVDANSEGGCRLYLNGGVLFAIGGLENGAVLSQACYQASSWNKNSWYSLTLGSDTYCFKTPSGGSNGLVVSGASEPAVLSGVTPSGGSSVFNEMGILGGSASGGSAVSLSSYSGGAGMGGGRGPGGW